MANDEPLQLNGKPVEPMTAEERADLLVTMERAAGGMAYGELDILRMEATIRAGEKELLDLAKLAYSAVSPNIPTAMELQSAAARIILGPGRKAISDE